MDLAVKGDNRNVDVCGRDVNQQYDGTGNLYSRPADLIVYCFGKAVGSQKGIITLQNTNMLYLSVARRGKLLTQTAEWYYT